MHGSFGRQAGIALFVFSLASIALAQIDLHHHPVRRTRPLGDSAPTVAISPGAWSQVGKITADFHQRLSGTVAVANDTIVVGTESFEKGIEAFVFTRPTGASGDMQPVATLSVPVGNFYTSVAIDGDTIVVGDNDGDYGPGAAYIFVKPAGGWRDMGPTAILSSTDSMNGDTFGASVAISGDIFCYQENFSL
jgi:hypothetical protein